MRGATGLVRRLRDSLDGSVGDVVFGMEDGTVSIFGLVLGVAMSARSSREVLVAGATGAVAAAVSMMAGAFLQAESEEDVRSVRDGDRKAARNGSEEATRAVSALREAGVPEDEARQVGALLSRRPASADALRRALAPPEPERAGPVARALWMFGSDLFAAAVPVLPFAFLSLERARLVSLGLTTALLLVLGIGRGLVARKSLVRSTAETLVVAAFAAGAGVGIGWLLR